MTDSPHSSHKMPEDASTHAIETRVRRELLSSSQLSVSSLVVRRMPNGVCLEGIVKVHDDSVDVDAVVKQISGVEEVRNHLLVCAGRC